MERAVESQICDREHSTECLILNLATEINSLLLPTTQDKRLVVAIGGYTTLGKSTLSKQLAHMFEDSVVLQTDSFEPDRVTKRKLGVTGDEPEAINFEQMTETIRSLVDGTPTQIRDYDHTKGVYCHWREVLPAGVIILDGTSSLYSPMQGIPDIAVFLRAEDAILAELAEVAYKTVRNFGDEEFDKFWIDYTNNRRHYIDPSIEQAGIIVNVTINRGFESPIIKNCLEC